MLNLIPLTEDNFPDIFLIWVPPQCWSILGCSTLMISNTTHSQEIIDHWPLPNETTPAIDFEKSHYSFFCVEFSGWCHVKMAPENGKMQRCQIWQLIVETLVVLEIIFFIFVHLLCLIQYNNSTNAQNMNTLHILWAFKMSITLVTHGVSFEGHDFDSK